MTTDVVVVGGGIQGVAAAFFLSRAGVRTLVLERKEALGALTTAASTECFRAQFVLPEHIALMQESMGMLDSFSDLVGIPDCDIGMHKAGYLYVTARPDGARELEVVVEHQRRHGLRDVNLLPAPELQQSFPYISADATAALYRAGDGWLSTHRVTYGLAKGSKARFLVDVEVTDFLMDGWRLTGVQTSKGTVYADAVVLAAGPFSRRLAGWMGVDLPLRIDRIQESVIRRHDSIPHDAPVTIDLDTRAFWRPELRGAYVSNSKHETMEKPVDPVPAERTFPAFAMEAASRLSPFWNDVAASLRSSNVSVHAGQSTHTPDDKAIIGPYPGIEAFYMSVGHSAHGVMTALGSGRLLADLVVGAESDEGNPFSIRRFIEGWELAVEGIRLGSPSQLS